GCFDGSTENLGVETRRDPLAPPYCADPDCNSNNPGCWSDPACRASGQRCPEQVAGYCFGVHECIASTNCSHPNNDKHFEDCIEGCGGSSQRYCYYSASGCLDAEHAYFYVDTQDVSSGGVPR